MKKRIRLTESDLHRIIIEAINELDWKTYANASEKDKTNYTSEDEELIALELFKNLGYSEKDKWRVNHGDTFRQCLEKAHKIAIKKANKASHRRYKFQDAAKDKFNKDYGFEDETGSVTLGTGRWDGGGTSWNAYMMDRNGNINHSPKYFITNQEFYGQNGQHTPGKWCVGTVGWAGAVPCSPDFDTPEEAQAFADENNMSTKRTNPSNKLLSAYKKAREEVKKYDPYDGTSLSRNKPSYKYEKGNGWVFDDEVEKNFNEAITRAIHRVLR